MVLQSDGLYSVGGFANMANTHALERYVPLNLKQL